VFLDQDLEIASFQVVTDNLWRCTMFGESEDFVVTDPKKENTGFSFSTKQKTFFFLCVCATDPPKQNFVRSPLLCIVSPYLLIYGDNILYMTVCGAVPYLRILRFSEISPK